MAKNHAIPSAGYSVTVTVRIENKVGAFAKLINQFAEIGGSLAEVELIEADFQFTVRKITINTKNEEASNEIIAYIKDDVQVELLDAQDDTLKLHEGGKLKIESVSSLNNADELSRAYTPGVARVCKMIHENPENAYKYTIKNDCVAVVTDGSAVLGLGNIGPEAAMPVMEGKSALFKEFAGVNSFPIALNTQDVQEIIQTVKMIAPAFGGINLEDIAAPRCFEIEDRLIEELDIPVFHDDQHGTAVVVMAGVINACKILGRKLEDLKVVVNGFGAGGVACTKILMESGVRHIVGCDSVGTVYRGRKERMNSMKNAMAEITNPDNIQGKLGDAMRGADMFLGLSQPNVVTRDMVLSMNSDPIIFTLANPVPEIFPDEIKDIAAIIATGRSDYPNQVNNVLCFPGIFKGAMECRATKITMGMKISAAKAIAESVNPEFFGRDRIIPSVFNRKVAYKVAEAVKAKAIEEGVARIK